MLSQTEKVQHKVENLQPRNIIFHVQPDEIDEVKYIYIIKL